MAQNGPFEIRVTVAVATCGRPDALVRCLEAIGTQTRSPDQLVVIDQGPAALARDVIGRSGLTIDYVQQERLGLSASRNLALARTRGSILAVTDDDCFPDPGWLAAIVRAFELHPRPAAVTGPILSPPGDPPEGMCAFSLRLSADERVFTGRVIPWHVGTGANFAAEVDWLQRLGGWDERLGVGTPGLAAEDCDVIDRLLVAGGSIRYEPTATVHHDWQPRERRGATRWSYGYGIGALCGLRVAKRDFFGVSMIASFARRQFAVLIRELLRWNWDAARQRWTGIAAAMPGFVYGLRAARGGPQKN